MALYFKWYGYTGRVITEREEHILSKQQINETKNTLGIILPFVE